MVDRESGPPETSRWFSLSLGVPLGAREPGPGPGDALPASAPAKWKMQIKAEYHCCIALLQMKLEHGGEST